MTCNPTVRASLHPTRSARSARVTAKTLSDMYDRLGHVVCQPLRQPSPGVDRLGQLARVWSIFYHRSAHVQFHFKPELIYPHISHNCPCKAHRHSSSPSHAHLPRSHPPKLSTDSSPPAPAIPDTAAIRVSCEGPRGPLGCLRRTWKSQGRRDR